MHTKSKIFASAAALLAVIAIGSAAVRHYRVQINSPRNGETVTDSLEISGTSSRPIVNVSGFVRDNKVFSDVVRVRNGRWVLTKGVAPGPLTIRAVDEDSDHEINVTVVHDDSNDYGGGGVRPGVLNISSPREDASYRVGDVRFTGRAASGSVRLQVYRGSRRVYNGDVRVRNGSWSQTVRLAQGEHRATVEQSRRSDSVNFRVGTPSSVSDQVSISSPRDGASVGRRVTFSGSTSGRSVNVRITKGRMIVFNGSQRANNRRWSFQRTLDPGTYQVTISTGDASDAVTIRVR